MIDCLNGTLLEKTPDNAVISCAGVGYFVSIPSSCAGKLPAIGEQCMLYTSLAISENDIALYGFADRESRQMFRLLTGVSGVGPKAGLSILSVLSSGQVALSISAGDHKAFTAANGVGTRIAQRIVLELKDKVGKGLSGGVSLSDIAGAANAPSGAVAQAMAALTGLGYTGTEAAQAVAQIDTSLPTAEIIRLALQSMGKGR